MCIFHFFNLDGSALRRLRSSTASSLQELEGSDLKNKSSDLKKNEKCTRNFPKKHVPGVLESSKYHIRGLFLEKRAQKSAQNFFSKLQKTPKTWIFSNFDNNFWALFSSLFPFFFRKSLRIWHLELSRTPGTCFFRKFRVHFSLF